MKPYTICFFWLAMACVLSITGCNKKLHPVKMEKRLYPVTRDLPGDSVISEFYKPYKASIDSLMNSVLAVAAVEIKRDRPEGLLNNLVVDAMAEIAEQNNISFDFVHANYFGLRVPLLAGEIKTYKIYEMMPFENYMVTVKLKGTDMQELFDYMAARGGEPVAGVSYRIENRKASDIRIGSNPLDTASVYTILTSDYTANGGDEAMVYERAYDRHDFPVKVRDAIITWLKQQNKAGKLIKPAIEGRILTDKANTHE